MSQGQIGNIKAYFVISESKIPKISTPNSPPNYASLQLFQDTIDEKSMVVPVTNTDLGHTASKIKNSISLQPAESLT